jgi:hypothetical protein
MAEPAEHELAYPAGGFEPGGHNDAYWMRVAPAEIDWMANELARTAP